MSGKICPIMSYRIFDEDSEKNIREWRGIECQQSKCQLWVEVYSHYLNEKKEHDLIGGHCGLISRG